MTSTSGLILDQVVALIEPLTRFDRYAVVPHEESEKSLSCSGVWTASIAISSSVSDGSGKLLSGVRDAGSQSGMERAINETISDERSNFARRIQGWCGRQAQSSPSAYKPLAYFTSEEAPRHSGTAATEVLPTPPPITTLATRALNG